MRKYVNYSSNQTGYVKIATMKILVRRAKIVPGIQGNGCPASLVLIEIKRKTTLGNKTEINESFEKSKLFNLYEKGFCP